MAVQDELYSGAGGWLMYVTGELTATLNKADKEVGHADKGILGRALMHSRRARPLMYVCGRRSLGRTVCVG